MLNTIHMHYKTAGEKWSECCDIPCLKGWHGRPGSVRRTSFIRTVLHCLPVTSEENSSRRIGAKGREVRHGWAVHSRDSTAEIFFHAVALCTGQCGKTCGMKESLVNASTTQCLKSTQGCLDTFGNQVRKDGKSAMRIQNPLDNRLAKPASLARRSQGKSSIWLVFSMKPFGK